jgi:hypothetical protein
METNIDHCFTIVRPWSNNGLTIVMGRAGMGDDLIGELIKRKTEDYVR